VENRGSLSRPCGPRFQEHDREDDQTTQHHQAAEYQALPRGGLDDDLDHRRAEDEDVAQAEEADAWSDFPAVVPPGPLADDQEVGTDEQRNGCEDQ
jgi:hypothetical protein